MAKTQQLNQEFVALGGCREPGQSPQHHHAQGVTSRTGELPTSCRPPRALPLAGMPGLETFLPLALLQVLVFKDTWGEPSFDKPEGEVDFVCVET